MVAGPYHPAFRQLVEASIWYDAIAERIKKINSKVSKIQILANEQDINNIVGHKRENLRKLQEIYEVNAKVVKENKIKPGKFELKIIA